MGKSFGEKYVVLWVSMGSIDCLPLTLSMELRWPKELYHKNHNFLLLFYILYV